MGLVVGGLGGLATEFHHYQAGHGDRLASQGLRPVLDLEDSPRKAGATGGPGGRPIFDSYDEPGQPSLGRTADSWRTAQSWNCRRRNERQQVQGPPSSAASAWTTSSCSAKGACTVTCKVSWTTIIGAGRTWDWRRTLQFLARSNRLTWGGLLRCRKSADSIIVTSAAPHKGIFGAMLSAFWPGPLRGPMDGHRVRAREAPQEAFVRRRPGASDIRSRSLKTSQMPWIPADHDLRRGFRERQSETLTCLHQRTTEISPVLDGFLKRAAEQTNPVSGTKPLRAATVSMTPAPLLRTALPGCSRRSAVRRWPALAAAPFAIHGHCPTPSDPFQGSSNR